MKMLTFSFVWLFIVILIWSLFYYLSIEKTIDYFEDELKSISLLVSEDDYNQARVETIKILNRWNKTEKLWVYFVHQGDVDEISSSIRKIDIYIYTENKPLALSEIETLKMYLKMVEGNESLSLENLF